MLASTRPIANHSSTHRRSVGPPTRALVSWAVAYPLITTVLALGGQTLDRLPLLLRTLALTGILIPAMAVAVPAVIRRIDRGKAEQ